MSSSIRSATIGLTLSLALFSTVTLTAQVFTDKVCTIFSATDPNRPDSDCFGNVCQLYTDSCNFYSTVSNVDYAYSYQTCDTKEGSNCQQSYFQDCCESEYFYTDTSCQSWFFCVAYLYKNSCS